MFRLAPLQRYNYQFTIINYQFTAQLGSLRNAQLPHLCTRNYFVVSWLVQKLCHLIIDNC